MQEHQFLPNFGIDVFALLNVFLFPLSLSLSLSDLAWSHFLLSMLHAAARSPEGQGRDGVNI